MKKFNEAFENLRQKLPSKVLLDSSGEKDTKVSALRSAIHYIKSLQDLLADCDSGNLEEEVYRTSLAMDTAAAAAAASQAKSDNKSEKVKTKRPASKKKSVKRLSASN